MIYEFNGYIPVVHPTAFVHPQANVTGNVIIGADVYIGPGAVLRGEWGQIILEAGCNVQENCVVHIFPGKTVHLKEGAHIGHGAIIHGASVGAYSLVGMNAVLMDDVEVGADCLIGALCFVPANTKIPDRKLVVGNPAKIIKDLSQEMVDWKRSGTALYQALPAECHATLKPCTPLTKIPENRKVQDFSDYKTWHEMKPK
jgi:carbonic anhydrase/acetyltransferase-like protein (isoleucine patch superfamily)